MKWDRYQTEPTPENVDALARVLEYPKAFFFESDIGEPENECISFRSQTSMSAAERDAALAAGAIGFLISDWVQERFELPEVKLPEGWDVKASTL